MNIRHLLVISMYCLAFIFSLLLVLIVVPAIVNAATINGIWTYTADDQANIDTFRIYDHQHMVVVNDIPAADRTAVIDTADQCGSWYIVAVAGEGDQEVESGPSTIATWCPPDQDPPPTPGVFSVSGTIPGTLKIEAVQ